MNIRRATVADAVLLAALNEPVQLLHHQARPGIFKPPVSNDEISAFYQQVLAQPDTSVYIAGVNGQAIGYVVARIIRRPDNPFCHPMEWILIDQISINPECQGKGYGKALLGAVFDLAREQHIKRVILDVWNFNLHAIEFYKHEGFRVFNQRLEIDLMG